MSLFIIASLFNVDIHVLLGIFLRI